MIKAKLYKILNLLVQLLIGGVLLYFIHYQFVSKETEMQLNLSWSLSNWGLLIVAVLLVYVNWGVETFKWNRLISRIQYLNFKTAFQSVLFGVSLGFFTPNQIGELGGRLILIESNNRGRVLLMTAFTSFCQLLITLIAGLISFIILNEDIKNLFGSYMFPFYAVAIILAFCGVVWFSFRKFIIKKLNKYQWAQKVFAKIRRFKNIAIRDWFITLTISSFRYLIFSIQYYLLLRFFDVNIEMMISLSLISIVFFAGTFIPGGALIEMGVRGSLALSIFGLFSENSSGILAAAFTLWFLNKVVPALFGLLSLRKFKFVQISKVV